LHVLQHALAGLGVRRCPILALDLRHGSSSLDESESTQCRRYARGMAERFLGGLATVVARHRRAVFATWLALLAAGGWFSLLQSEHLSGGGWEVPGSPSLRVASALHEFPGATSPAFFVFVTNPYGPRSRLEEVRRLVAHEPTVHPGRPLVLAGGRAALLPLAFTGKTSNAIDEATRLRHLLVDAHTKVIGEPAVWSNFQDVSKRQLAHGEVL